ncbi:TonB-dependent siderophore receptor [Bordetella genomosp. 4]|uniref:TonB-dependent siderophore receptor n=1 Tax=Bordetella genomosp. 4 TaxID=463044 RepID=UPI001177B1F1|nr:TonB-dependent siderophore receptor [Bordetella genomosp. 4]
MAISAGDRRRTRIRRGSAQLALLVLLALTGSLAHAQNAPSPAELRVFQVTPGPLVTVLQQIASQAHVLLGFDPQLARGLQSPGLAGRYNLPAAFAAVLQPHGLQAYEDAPGSFQIRREWTLPPAHMPATPVVGEESGPFVALDDTAGTKTLTPLARVPQSVSVITAEDMRARDARSVPQALQYTPGVQINNYGGNEVRNDWLVLRGFDAKLTGDYRDGLSQMPYDQIRARVPTYALERIEVVRGPVSSLYGQAAPGGIVNRVTKRPTQTVLREAALQAGSFDFRQAYLDLGGPWDDSSNGRVRLTATGRVSGTQDKYDGTHRYRDDLAYVAPAFSWHDADTSITVLTHYQYDRNDGESRAYYPTRVLVGDYRYDRNQRDFFSAGYLFEHRLDAAWTVRQNARYQRGNMLLRNLYAGTLQADGRTLPRTQLQSREWAEGVVVDSQLEGVVLAAGLRHTLLAGVDVRRLSGSQHYRQADAPSLDLRDPRYGLDITMPADATTVLDVRQVSSQWGLYAQDQVQGGRWTLTLGARRDGYRDATEDRLNRTRTRADGHAYTWRAGLSYEFARGVAPYLSYATAFSPQPGTAYDGDTFEPNRSRQVEVGVKIQPPQSQSLITLALFDLNQRNVLTTDPDPAHLGFSVATGKVRAHGAELEARIRLEAGWDVLAAYTYNNVEILSDEAGTRGNMPVVTPRHMASLWLGRSFGAGWSAGLGVRYLGSTYIDAANTMKNNGAAMVDASLGYEFDQWRLSVDATNLFDKQAVVCRNDRANCRYGAERTVLATVTYRY